SHSRVRSAADCGLRPAAMACGRSRAASIPKCVPPESSSSRPQQTLGRVKYSTVSLSHGVVDQRCDLDERDARPHAVEPRDPLHQRLIEEILGRFLGVPHVEVDRLACFWVESERLASQSVHFFEPRARRLGDLANLRAVEVTLVAKRNENSDHGYLPCRTGRKGLVRPAMFDVILTFCIHKR